MDYDTHVNDVWYNCLNMFKNGVQKGLQFAATGNCDMYYRNSNKKEEYAVKSRYLHRGFYCPSPVLNLILTNSRRGRILRKPTKRSKITNRYIYNNEGKIDIIEYFADGISTGYEYLVRENDVQYGFVYNNTGALAGISIETYSADRIQSYMWAKCHNSSSKGNDWQADYVRYETYEYEHDSKYFTGINFYLIALIEDDHKEEMPRISELVNYEKYRPIYENGQLVGVTRGRFETTVTRGRFA